MLEEDTMRIMLAEMKLIIEKIKIRIDFNNDKIKDAKQELDEAKARYDSLLKWMDEANKDIEKLQRACNDIEHYLPKDTSIENKKGSWKDMFNIKDCTGPH